MSTAEDARRELLSAFERILTRSGAPHPESLATELLTALTGRGWRWLATVAPNPDAQAWRQHRDPDPGAAARGRELIRRTTTTESQGGD